MTPMILACLYAQAEIEVPAVVDPLGRLIPVLAQRVGMTLIAGANVRDDVLAIASPKRPIRELMDGIAEAANATWEARKEGWVLFRTRNQEFEDERSDVEERIKWIRNALKDTPVDEPFDATRAEGLATYRFDVKSRESNEAKIAQLAVMNARSPLGRLTRRLVEGIGVEAVASLPQGKRSVFSTRPTKMQLLLEPKAIGGPLRSFAEEQNLYAAAVKSRGEPEGNRTTYVSGFDFVQEVPVAWDRALVIVETMNPSQTFLRLKLLDREGVALASIRCYMNRNDYSRPPAAEPLTPVVELLPSQLAVGEALLKGQPLNAEHRMPFSDPAVREPLAFLNREAVKGWSEFKNKPVFALLSDGMMMAFAVRSTPYRLGNYLSTISWMAQVRQTGERIVVRPLEPARARQTRVDRRALSEFIKSFEKVGYVTLESQVNLAMASSSLYGSRTDSFLIPALSIRPPSSRDSAILRLIGLANPSQRAELMAGAGLTVADMSPAQKAWAAELFYNPDLIGVEWGPADHARAPRPIQGDITDLFPNGLPPTASFKTTVLAQDAVRFKFQDAEGGGPSRATETIVAGAEALAETLFRRTPNDPKEFQFGRTRSLSAALVVGPDHQLLRHFTEDVIPRDSRWLSYAALPEAFRGRVDEMIKRLREQNQLPP